MQLIVTDRFGLTNDPISINWKTGPRAGKLMEEIVMSRASSSWRNNHPEVRTTWFMSYTLGLKSGYIFTLLEGNAKSHNYILLDC